MFLVGVLGCIVIAISIAYFYCKVDDEDSEIELKCYHHYKYLTKYRTKEEIKDERKKKEYEELLDNIKSQYEKRKLDKENKRRKEIETQLMIDNIEEECLKEGLKIKRKLI